MSARVEDAVKIYGIAATQVRALDHVSVEFPAGRFTAVMGPSGSGKSTLMHCAAGLDTLTAGSAWIGGRDLSTLNDRQLTLLRRASVGFVFQAFNLVPTLTVLENITLPLDLAGRGGREREADREWIDSLVDVVGLGDRLRHRPSELSGGQQQRVAVARALVARPEVVFADEPTGNLDSKAGDEVLQMLRRAADEYGQTVIMVTHDPHAAAVADHIVVLVDGKVVRETPAGEADEVVELMKAVA
jgi:putative ABC transport system ATP-binding protein